MAKFFISNKREYCEQNHIVSSRYFTKSQYTEFADVCGYVYEKQCYSLGNSHLDNNSGGGIFVVGTYIYKEATGQKAAEQIWADFDDNIGVMKKNIIGNYAICIFKHGKVTVFNDYFGLYDVCYIQKGDSMMIGNSLRDVAAASSETAINEFAFVQECFQLGTFPELTIFQNIHKLTGREYITIDNGKLEIHALSDEDYKLRYTYVDQKTALKDVSEMLKQYASLIDRVFRSETIFLTGGLDSRMNFGAYYSVDANMRTEYWSGRAMQMQDQQLVAQISRYFHKEYRILDGENPEESYSVDWEYQKKVFEEIGFTNMITDANKTQIANIKQCGQNKEFLAFGYFCEAIRLRDWAMNLHTNTFSLDNYIDDYYINKDLTDREYPNLSAYREFIKRNLIEQLNELGITGNYDAIPMKIFESFRWVMARQSDSRMEFLNNNYTYSFALLSVPCIHEAILTLPPDVIRGGVFQIKIIRMLNSDLVKKFDVYSHLRDYRVTRFDTKMPKLTMKNIADRVFRFVPFIKPLCYRLYRNHVYNFGNTLSTTVDDIENLQREANLPFRFDFATYSNMGIKRIRQVYFGYTELLKHKQ